MDNVANELHGIKLSLDKQNEIVQCIWEVNYDVSTYKFNCYSNTLFFSFFYLKTYAQAIIIQSADYLAYHLLTTKAVCTPDSLFY